MKKVFVITSILLILLSCHQDDLNTTSKPENPDIVLDIPPGFPPLNASVKNNKPTKYGTLLGEKLFQDNKFSTNNTISCASCHKQAHAFADNNKQAIGIYNRVGLRNTPPIQNLAFMRFYNWDGHILQLEKQPLVPIITHEEMNSSIVEVIAKLSQDPLYPDLFSKAFGDPQITPTRIYESIAQYEYTLISANSKYDRVRLQQGDQFTRAEENGYAIFKLKCASCHSTELFTDQSFRNIGFPINTNTNEAGRGRVTGNASDYMRFRVSSLRNIEYTAPYGSFGQFPTLSSLLDYLDAGVINADNLDPLLKENGNRIPLTAQEKQDIIAFLKTLSDDIFVGNAGI